jgi:hypothetical protein
MDMRPQQDHEAAPLSTRARASPHEELVRDSERANALRYVAGGREGHVESHFVKANSPDGQRALWIKHTVLRPTSRPEAAVAEVWAIAFERGNQERAPRVTALKRSVPARELVHTELPFSLRTPFASLQHGRAQGRLQSATHLLAWDFAYACPHAAFRPFPVGSMYTGPFPRTKTLTPAPNSTATGWFELDGARWNLDGYRAAQGHNWGKGHAHAYAWVHSNAWVGAGDAPVFVELLSARVKVGPVLTPFLSVGAVAIEDAIHRFDGPRALLSRRVRITPRSYQVSLRTRSAMLDAKFMAEPHMIAALRYQDPDGSSLFCLNSKLAYGEVRLTAQGRTWSFKSDQVALEVGTRRGDHGFTIMI